MREYRPVRLPPRGGSVPPSMDGRDCSLYRFIVRDPNTDYTTRRLGYVGETVRMPLDRLLEHVRDQPWADTIVGWEVDDAVYPGKAAVLAAERAAVEEERPLYNHEWNLGNPDRIEIWQAHRQRAARDAAKGASTPRPYQAPARPRPAVDRRSEPRAERRRAEPWPRVRLSRRQRRTLAWTGTWLVASAALWWAQSRWPAPWSGWWRLGVAAAAPLLVVWWWEGLSRRRRRRLVLGVAAGLAVVAAALLAKAWPTILR